MPEVSVLVPNYNHEYYLKQRLDSIFNQSYQDFEVILLDDCSTDNSVKILKEYSKHPKVTHFIANTTNSGSTFKQWQKGIELAKGEYIWIAESDDVAQNDFLQKVMEKVSDSDCGIVFTHSVVINEKSEKQYNYHNNSDLYSNDFIKKGKEIVQSHMIYRNVIPNASAVVFSRELFKKIDLNKLVNFKINGDWYLWSNILLLTNCCFISIPLNMFRRHDGASSPLNVQNFKNIEEAFIIINFFKSKNIKIHYNYWISVWLSQASYSLSKLLKSNFTNILKQTIKLNPLIIFSIPFQIFKHKLIR